MPLAKLLRLASVPAGDAELLRRYADTRDEAAFAELVRRHGPLVRGVCRRMLGATDADDAAQAVFLTLARNAGRVRNADPLSGFLHGVSVRVCRKALARRPRPVVRSRPATADPADEASWREVAAAVDAALARLPDKLRQPLVQCYLDGLTRDEAAVRLGWPVAALRGRLDRGRTKLRADLLRRGFGLPAGLLAVLLSTPRGDAAGWAAGVMRTVLDPAGPPAAVAALTVGMGWAMPTKLVLGVVLSLGLAGGLATVAGRPAAEQPKAEPAPEAKAKAVEIAKLTTPELPTLVGTWENVEGGDGPRKRTIRITFTADGTAVERHVYTGDWAVETTYRSTYTLQGQTITCKVVEAWSNYEPIPVVETYRTHGWQVNWGKAEGRVALYLTDGRGQRSRYTPVPPDPADADLAPEVGRLDRRPLVKEPGYKGKPLYLELTFGPAAACRVWLAVDGDRAYLDRNGNGDLTDDGEPAVGVLVPATATVMPQPSTKGESPSPPDPPPVVRNFGLGSVTDPARSATYSDITLTVTAKSAEVAYATLRLRVNGGRWEVAGTGSLLLTKRSVAARRLHFDAERLILQPTPNADRFVKQMDAIGGRERYELRVQIGTPGVGRDTFVARSLDDLPADKHPVAVLTLNSGSTRKGQGQEELQLNEQQSDQHGVWSVFMRSLGPIPFTSNNKLSVTLSFPDYPAGKIEPATYETWLR